MMINPLFDRILIQNIAVQDTTKSGFILSSSINEKPFMAKVIAVGPGSVEVEMQIKTGEKIIYNKYAGTDVKINGEEYILIRQSDVLAVVEE